MSLDVDQLVRLQQAILLKQPDPIGTEESAEAYEKLKKEMESQSGVKWDFLRDI